MDAREYLQQLKKIDVAINQKIHEACELKTELKRGLRPINYMEKVQTSTTDSASFEKLVNKMIDLEKEIDEEIDYFVNKKHEIINEIQGLDKAIYVQILYKKYVEFKEWRVISREMHYSRANAFKLLQNALNAFEKKYFDKINETV